MRLKYIWTEPLTINITPNMPDESVVENDIIQVTDKIWQWILELYAPNFIPQPLEVLPA